MDKRKLSRPVPQLAPYQFKKGQSGNPKGRPPGKSLKEYTREMLSAMTDDERQEFLKGIPKDKIWEMAEGKPKQDTEGTLRVEMPKPLLYNVRDNDSDKQALEAGEED